MRNRRLRSSLASIAATVATAVAASTGFVLAQGRQDGPPAIRDAKRTPGLGVKGSTSRLYPGGTSVMRLEVKNRSRLPLTLRNVRVKVRDARPGCPAGLLRVKPFKTRARIRARRSNTVKVRVTLSVEAPDACQGARFPLTYRVKASRTRVRKSR